jgi:hypothetical protein
MGGGGEREGSSHGFFLKMTKVTRWHNIVTVKAQRRKELIGATIFRFSNSTDNLNGALPPLLAKIPFPGTTKTILARAATGLTPTKMLTLTLNMLHTGECQELQNMIETDILSQALPCAV